MVLAGQSRTICRAPPPRGRPIQGIGSMSPLARAIGASVMVTAVLAGSGAIAYSLWTRPVADGDAAVDGGLLEQALTAYRDAEARFDRYPASKELFAGEY